MEDLFCQQFGDSIYQFVLNTDARLPNKLTLTVGLEQSLVSHSGTLGANQNIHLWRLDLDIGWKEGQKMPLTLTETQLLLLEIQASSLAF